MSHPLIPPLRRYQTVARMPAAAADSEPSSPASDDVRLRHLSAPTSAALDGVHSPLLLRRSHDAPAAATATSPSTARFTGSSADWDGVTVTGSTLGSPAAATGSHSVAIPPPIAEHSLDHDAEHVDVGLDAAFAVPHRSQRKYSLARLLDRVHERVFGARPRYQSYNVARYAYEEARRAARLRDAATTGDRGGGSHRGWWKERLRDHAVPSETVAALFASARFRVAVVTAAFLVDLCLVCLYVVEMIYVESVLGSDARTRAFNDLDLEPVWLWTPRPVSVYWAALALEMFNLGYAVVTFLVSMSIHALSAQGYSPLDLVTSFPFFVSLFLREGRFLYIPYFLRSIRLIPRMRRLIFIRDEVAGGSAVAVSVPAHTHQTQLTLLLVRLANIVFVTTCAVHYTELVFGATPISLFEALYMTVVTITTVGYGDVTVKNAAGRVVIIFAILLSFVTIPAIASSFMDKVRAYREGGGSYSSSSAIPHVVVVGNVSSASVFMSLLHAFFHSENAIPLRVVMLTRHAPSAEVRALMGSPAFRGRVFYLVGSALDPVHLQRARVRDAQAVFFLADTGSSATGGYHDTHVEGAETEDERNVVRVWSVARYAPRVDLYVYVQRPEYERYHAARANEVVCVQDLKQALLASNLVSRGVATLFTNLINNATPLQDYSRPWLVQYGDGLGQEVYKLGVPAPLVGMRFHRAAAYLFAEFQVTAIALRAPLRDGAGKVRDGHVLLNPAADCSLFGDDELVCIAQSPREIALVESLDHAQFAASKAQYPSLFSEIKDERSITPISLRTNSAMTGGGLPGSQRVDYRHTIPATAESFVIGQPPSPFTTDPNKIPDCHLDPRPPRRIEDVTITSLAETDPRGNGHVVVIAPDAHLFRFLCTLRAAHIPAADLRWVVVVVPSLPQPDDFRFLAPFPRVLYMQGNARRRRDLLRANIPAASRIVILAHRASDDPAFVDLQAILIRHLAMATAARFAPPAMAGRPPAYTMVELCESASINLLAPSNDLVHQHASTGRQSPPPSHPPRLEKMPQDSRETLVVTSLEKSGGKEAAAMQVNERPPIPTSLTATRHQRRLGLSLAEKLKRKRAKLLRRGGSGSSPADDSDSDDDDGARVRDGDRAAAREFGTEIGYPVPPPRLRVFYDPHFASGEAFCGDLLNTVLVQHLINPTILDLARLFAGVRNRADRLVSHTLRVRPSFLSTVELPAGYAGRTYRDLFMDLAAGAGVVPIGLYRAPSTELGNAHWFVYTAPHPDVVLLATDLVYVLSQADKVASPEPQQPQVPRDVEPVSDYGGITDDDEEAEEEFDSAKSEQPRDERRNVFFR
ncbi:hypothetical protein H9P43_003878 [Blastocladiella emersonii ATCC 22665]|nr:hypothetical protein H9P43_003878 [Blastocladiella emersonii ATCC 22665]